MPADKPLEDQIADETGAKPDELSAPEMEAAVGGVEIGGAAHTFTLDSPGRKGG